MAHIMDASPRAAFHHWPPRGPALRYSLLPCAAAAAILLRRGGLSADLTAIFSALSLILLCLILPRLRFYSILPIIFAFAFWRADAVYPNPHFTPHTCTGTWQINNFPRPRYPIGQYFPLTAISTDCPFLSGHSIAAAAYQPSRYRIGDSFTAALNIHAAADAYTAAVANAQPAAIPISLLPRWRRALQDRIHNHYDSHAPWAEALILGLRTNLHADARTALKHTGTVHLLAISGLHLAVICGILYLLIKWLAALAHPYLRCRIQPHSIALAASLAFGLFFVCISGAQPPIIRAWIMLATAALAWHLRGIRAGLHALPTAILIILLYDPTSLYNLGTWLSITATAAVLLLIIPLQRLKSALLQWAALQTGVTAATLPLIWASYGGIALLSLPINLIIIPWLAPILLLLIAGLISTTLAATATAMLDWFLRPILLFTHTNTYLTPPWQPSLAAGILAAILMLSLYSRRWRTALFLLICTTAAILHPLMNRSQPLYIAGAAIYPDRGRAIFVNTGYAMRTRNDMQQHILPALRQKYLIPAAAIITADSPAAASGLKTLLEAYPNIPLYTTVPNLHLPFSIAYCPARTSIPELTFQHHDTCTASYAGRPLSPTPPQTNLVITNDIR